VEPREGDPANVEHVTCCIDNYVHWKEHDKVDRVKSSAHISMQMAKYSDKIN
jgi:hypothetical protein